MSHFWWEKLGLRNSLWVCQLLYSLLFVLFFFKVRSDSRWTIEEYIFSTEGGEDLHLEMSSYSAQVPGIKGYQLRSLGLRDPGNEVDLASPIGQTHGTGWVFYAAINSGCYHPPPGHTPGICKALCPWGEDFVQQGVAPVVGGGDNLTDRQIHAVAVSVVAVSTTFVGDWLENQGIAKLKNLFEGKKHFLMCIST